MEATPITLHFSTKRRCIVYVPWLSLLSFSLVLAGTITCGVGMHSALENTGDMLSNLLIDVRPYVATVQSVAVLSVVLCGLLAAAMVLVSCGRSWTEFAVDRRGKAVRGLQVWLGVSATLTVLWYLVLLLLAFLFFLSAIWYGVTYSSTGVLRVSIKYAQRAAERIKLADTRMDQALQSTADRLRALVPPASMPASAPSTYSGIVPYNTTGGVKQADSGNATSCSSDCLNLAVLEYVVKKRPCICLLPSLQAAQSHAEAAHSAVGALLVGSCLLWAGASFLLMTAAAEFAVARRERALLLRAQAAAAVARQPFDPRGGSESPATQKQLQEQQLQQLLMQHGAAAAGGANGGAAGVPGYLVSEADDVPLLKEQGQQQYVNYHEKPYEEPPYQGAPYQEQPYQEYPYEEQSYQERPYQQQQTYVEMSYQQQQSYRLPPYQGHSAVVIATGAEDGGALNGAGRS